MSSFMHNEDGLLQFYAVHFDYEAMAFHGGDILTKAAYVNTAIQTIQSQYKQQRPNIGKFGFYFILRTILTVHFTNRFPHHLDWTLVRRNDCQDSPVADEPSSVRGEKHSHYQCSYYKVF
ncbi:hypothetical protein EON65_09160 [archaeon]|nr:MAG: hypothetical protein EON65_09160 [archaeon]